jgi:predicted TPR repeat methyltransferase
MQTSDKYFDYIICADTFVYFGELQAAFVAAFRVLKPSGHFIFSVEQHHELSKGDYHLQPNGRYSHSAVYLNNALLATGFMICSIEDVVPRMENGKEVDGALILVRKH